MGNRLYERCPWLDYVCVDGCWVEQSANRLYERCPGLVYVRGDQRGFSVALSVSSNEGQGRIARGPLRHTPAPNNLTLCRTHPGPPPYTYVET